jgi:ABC-type antimicrobial peptide transport system permease subunit
MSVGEAFLKNFNMKVKEGRAFNKNDYVKSDGKTIPVILGNGYLGTYNLGSEIESIDEFGNTFKLKVIGFLETGSLFCDDYSGNNIQALDNYIIYPRIKPNVKDIDMSVNGNDMKYKIILYNDIFKSYIKINKSELGNTSEIENEMKKFKSNIKLESIETGLSKDKDMIKETKSQAQVIFIIIFIFASVGFVSSILYSITHRLREFGVHLMQGATLNGIASMIFYEIAFVMLTSYIIALELINLLFSSDKILKLNLGTAIEMFIFVAAICILLSAAPIWKVLKLQIGELVKGDE